MEFIGELSNSLIDQDDEKMTCEEEIGWGKPLLVTRYCN